MKQKLISVFGSAGPIMYFVMKYFIGVVLQIAPLIILDLPLWAFLLLFLAMTSIPILSSIVNVVVWVWALVVAINGTQDWFTTVYYVLFAINALQVLFSLILAAIDVFSGD